ncbi:MAG: PIN domain-containing protein, partial [Bacteroidota bacterium]
AVLNPKSDIGNFILSSDASEIELYTPDFLRIEMERHLPKLVQLSGSTEQTIRKIMTLVYAQLIFISDAQIPFEYYKNAVPFVRDVDMDDLVFVALNDLMEETLWTGDMKLYRELKAKGYERVVTFQEIRKVFKI